MPSAPLPPPRTTFAQAKGQARPLTDAEIAGVLNGQLKIGPGYRRTGTHDFLMTSATTAADKRFFQDPKAVVQSRAKLAAVLERRLEVRYRDPNDPRRPAVDRAQQQFLQTTQQGVGRLDRYYTQLKRNGADRTNNPTPREDLALRGFRIPDPNDPQKFTNPIRYEDSLTAGDSESKSRPNPLEGMRSNIRVQEGKEQFIHWSSSAQVDAELSRTSEPPETRIYINPSPEAAVDVFDEIATMADEQGLAVKMKFMDSALEGTERLALPDRDEGLRADRMLIYASEADVDKMLAIVEHVQARHPEAFAGREPPKTARQISAGVAVGSERAGGGTSLTTHRAHFMEQVGWEVKNDLGLHDGKLSGKDLERAIAAYRTTFEKRALQEGIDPNNFGFDTSEGKALKPDMSPWGKDGREPQPRTVRQSTSRPTPTQQRPSVPTAQPARSPQPSPAPTATRVSQPAFNFKPGDFFVQTDRRRLVFREGIVPGVPGQPPKRVVGIYDVDKPDARPQYQRLAGPDQRAYPQESSVNPQTGERVVSVREVKSRAVDRAVAQSAKTQTARGQLQYVGGDIRAKGSPPKAVAVGPQAKHGALDATASFFMSQIEPQHPQLAAKFDSLQQRTNPAQALQTALADPTTAQQIRDAAKITMSKLTPETGLRDFVGASSVIAKNPQLEAAIPGAQRPKLATAKSAYMSL